MLCLGSHCKEADDEGLLKGEISIFNPLHLDNY